MIHRLYRASINKHEWDPGQGLIRLKSVKKLGGRRKRKAKKPDSRFKSHFGGSHGKPSAQVSLRADLGRETQVFCAFAHRDAADDQLRFDDNFFLIVPFAR